MCLGCAAVNTMLFSWGTLSEGGYVTITLSTVAAYITSNVVQKGIEHTKESPHAGQ